MNYYELLNIPYDADNDTIRRAFVRTRRKYAGEEEYQEIIEEINAAEKVLTDPCKRAEYDAQTLYEDKINELLLKLERVENDNNHTEALVIYKEILKIVPNWVRMINKYAICLFYENQEQEAIKEIKKAIELDEKNALYHANFAEFARQMGDYKTAEEEYRKAHEWDSINNDIILDLSRLYYKEMHNFKQAIMFLNECSSQNKEEPYRNVVFFCECIRAVMECNMQSNKQLVDVIFTKLEKLKSTEESENRKEGMELLSLLVDCSDHDQLDYVNRLKLIYENLQITDVTINNRYQFILEFLEFRKENGINETVKLFTIGAKEEEDQKIINNKIKRELRINPVHIKDSIIKTEENYPLIYDKFQDELKKLDEIAESWFINAAEYSRMNHDFGISANLKKVIEISYLWDALDETDNDKVKIIDLYMERFRAEGGKLVNHSISKMKVTYPFCYQLYLDLFPEEEDKASKDSKNQENRSTNSNQTVSISKNNPIRTTQKSTNKTSKKSFPKFRYIIILIMIGSIVYNVHEGANERREQKMIAEQNKRVEEEQHQQMQVRAKELMNEYYPNTGVKIYSVKDFKNEFGQYGKDEYIARIKKDAGIVEGDYYELYIEYEAEETGEICALSIGNALTETNREILRSKYIGQMDDSEMLYYYTTQIYNLLIHQDNIPVN